MTVFDRTVPSVTGLATAQDGRILYAAAHGRLIRFAASAGDRGFDRNYLPRMLWYTGDVDAHDVAVDDQGPVLAATAFDALVRPSEDHSFEIAWQPPFVAGEARHGDRCHLNGVATRDGSLYAATLTAATTAPDAWKDQRIDGGQVWSIPEGRPLAEGLCMPHSPRWHDGALYLHESGHARLIRLTGSGRIEPVVDLPGFPRGLAFIGRFAVVGLSRPRTSGSLQRLPFVKALRARRQQPRCGLAIVDLHTSRVVEHLDIEGELIHELYDVALLPSTRRPSLTGFRNTERFTRFSLP